MNAAFQDHYFLITAIIHMLVASALFHAGYTDLKSRIIKNKTSLFIATLFVPFCIINYLTGTSFNNAVTAPALTALLVLCVTSGLFSLRMMGGGDVKLMSAFALFAGPYYILPFLLYTTVCGGLVALGTLIYYQYFSVDKKPKLATVDMSSDIYLATLAQPSMTASNPQSQASSTNKKQLKVPYGLAISSVGLWVLFQRFLEISVG
jgi:prepilin peptidase CpaA